MKQKRPIALLALITSAMAFACDVLTLIMVEPQKVLQKTQGWIALVSGEEGAALFSSLTIFQLYDQIWPLYLVFFTLLMTITYFEVREQVIPDAVTIPGIIIGLGLVAGFRHISIVNAVSAAVIGFVALWCVSFLTEKRTGSPALGAGVLKMQAMVGVFLGIKGGLIALLIASFLGTLYGLIAGLLNRRGDIRSQTIEFGPFLALAALVVTFVPVDALIAGMG